MITSDLGVLLTDFSSSFKPTYLPLDDPSDFSFYFDTSSRRTCYIAPERFYASDSRLAEEKKAVAAANDVDAWNKRDGRVTEEMDVFSAGCVIAEMWTDGRVVFNLSELYAYKSGDIGLNGILDNIGDESVRVSHRQSRWKSVQLIRSRRRKWSGRCYLEIRKIDQVLTDYCRDSESQSSQNTSTPFSRTISSHFPRSQKAKTQTSSSGPPLHLVTRLTGCWKNGTRYLSTLIRRQRKQAPPMSPVRHETA